VVNKLENNDMLKIHRNNLSQKAKLQLCFSILFRLFSDSLLRL